MVANFNTDTIKTKEYIDKNRTSIRFSIIHKDSIMASMYEATRYRVCYKHSCSLSRKIESDIVRKFQKYSQIYSDHIRFRNCLQNKKSAITAKSISIVGRRDLSCVIDSETRNSISEYFFKLSSFEKAQQTSISSFRSTKQKGLTTSNKKAETISLSSSIKQSIYSRKLFE